MAKTAHIEPDMEARAAEADAPERPAQSPGLKACAWLGALSAVAAWALMMWAPVPSVVCSVAAVVLSSLGLRRGSGLLRDMCVTAIIAGGVLLLVFAIFYGALAYVDRLIS